MERDCGLRRLKDKRENQKGGPPKNASRMPLCAESPFSFEEPCCDIHGEITMGWQKTGLIITMKKSVLASAHGGSKSFRNSRAVNMLVFVDLHMMNSAMAQGLPQDLSPEEGTLCLLNDLLVHRLRWVVHDNGALLVVDLGIDTGVADQVDDPLLTLVLAETQASGQVPINEVRYHVTCFDADSFSPAS